MNFDLNRLVRPNIKALVPYSSARDEFGGDGRIFLDANENSFGSPLAADYSRYPDPYQTAIKQKIGEINSLDSQNIFVGHGSDEVIDLLIRIFCRPASDNIIICPPTYGVYDVAAGVNDVAVRNAPLELDFSLDVPRVLAEIDELTKLIFICSPNNPTGNSMNRESIIEIAESFDGLVVVDEAYIHFSPEDSLSKESAGHPNIVVLQTLSKAWGLAGLRVGFAFAHREVIDLLNRVKQPYNVGGEVQRLVREALENREFLIETVAEIIAERGRLAGNLLRFKFVDNVYPSDANFLLVRTTQPQAIYRFLLNNQIVIRDRSRIRICEGCLRITVGTQIENDELIGALTKYEKSLIY